MIVGKIILFLYKSIGIIFILYLSCWSQLSLVNILTNQKIMGPIDSYKYTRPFIKKYFFMNIFLLLLSLLFLPLFVGSLSIGLIIGYVFATYCTFICLEKNIYGIDIFWHSKELVQKRKMLFIYVLILFLVSIIIELCIPSNENLSLTIIKLIPLYFLVPFTISFWYENYKDVDGLLVAKSYQNWYMAGIIGWIVVLIILLVVELSSLGKKITFMAPIKEGVTPVQNTPTLKLTLIPTSPPQPRFTTLLTLDAISNKWSAAGVEIVPGKINSAVKFKGNGLSYIKIKSSSLNAIQDEFTISMWVKRENKNKSTLVWISDDNKSGFGILVGTQDQVLCRTVDGVSGRTIDTSTGYKQEHLPVDGQWHYLAVVMEGFHCSIYIDGQIETTQYNTHDNIEIANFAEISLGAQPSGEKMFKGSLDEIRIYNYSLFPEDIKKDMLTR